MRETGVGPLHGKFLISPSSVRDALPGYRLELEQHNERTVLFNLFDGDKLAFYIVPYHDCRPFGIHVVSDRIEVASHGWRVGRTLKSAAPLDACECWGDDTRTCYRRGEHVAVVFEQACIEDDHDLEALVGATITRVVWQPAPWGSEWEMHDEEFDCVRGER